MPIRHFVIVSWRALRITAAISAMALPAQASAGTAADPVGFTTLAVLLVATGLAGAAGRRAEP